MFRCFAEQNIPVVRAYELAEIDGAFLDPTLVVDKSEEMTDRSLQFVQHWQHVKNSSDVDCLTFDVKYVSLMPGSVKELDFSYCHTGIGSGALLVILFEDIEDHIALVPMSAALTTSQSTQGILPLISAQPTWYHPFMVRVDQIAMAVRGMFDAARGIAQYANPTIGNVLHG